MCLLSAFSNYAGRNGQGPAATFRVRSYEPSVCPFLLCRGSPVLDPRKAFPLQNAINHEVMQLIKSTADGRGRGLDLTIGPPG